MSTVILKRQEKNLSGLSLASLSLPRSGASFFLRSCLRRLDDLLLYGCFLHVNGKIYKNAKKSTREYFFTELSTAIMIAP
jgi:hypothetical protein